jgi:hypothetical protein
MALQNQETIIPEFIKRAIKKEVDRATEEELTEAQKRIEKRKVEIVSMVMLSVNRYMSMERVQDNYKFTIEIKP